MEKIIHWEITNKNSLLLKSNVWTWLSTPPSHYKLNLQSVLLFAADENSELQDKKSFI